MDYKSYIAALRWEDPGKAQFIEGLRAQLPTLVARQSAPGINPRTLSNLDARGEGPPQRVQHGRHIYYQREVYLMWLAERTKVRSNCNEHA